MRPPREGPELVFPISPHQSENVAIARHDVKALASQQVAQLAWADRAVWAACFMEFDDKQAAVLKHNAVLLKDLQFGTLDITDQLEAIHGKFLADLAKSHGLSMNRPESEGMLIRFPRAERASRNDEIGITSAIAVYRVRNGIR